MKLKPTYLAFGFMVVAILYLMFEEEINQLPKKVGPLKSPVPQGKDCNKVLFQGSTGPEVATLQRHLNQQNQLFIPLAPLVVDGIFGPLTAGHLVTATGQSSTTLNQIQACNA